MDPDINISDAAENIMANIQNTQAICLFGDPYTTAKFINQAYAVKPNLQFLIGVMSDYKTLQSKLDSNIKPNIVAVQGMPFYKSSTSTLISRYQSAMSAYDSTLEQDFIALEGYVTATFIVETYKNLEAPNISPSGSVEY